jgi:hypothetical protein
MRNVKGIKRSAVLCALVMICLASAACNGGSGSTTGPPVVLSLSLSSSMALAPQDGTPAQVTANITGTSGAVTIAVNGVPNGTSLKLAQPSGNTPGMITLTSSPATPPGNYTLSVSATAGAASSSQNLTLVVAVAAVVATTVDTNLGVNGRLQEFMSTSFQPAEWDYQFFLNHAATEPAQLNTLGPQHIRIQGMSQAVPMKSNTGTASDWDFMMLDAIVQPVLGVADHSPEFQIAVAPAWMQNASGQLDMANHLTDFVNYSANLVRYYNTGGFTVGTTHFQSASPNKITWWGIFNEYNINGLSAAQYVQLYNAMVPAMLAVDPTIQFSALEFSDFGFGTGDQGDPEKNLPVFLAAPNAGGVNAQVNILSTHFYSSCNQKDTDTQLFNTVPGFVNDVSYFYQEVKLRPDLGSVPVWVTENNVNADFDKGGGISACNGTPFVTDQRGTSAFFAAWRPYVFSQLGKAGNQALYHWDYDADPQYGEADFGTGIKYLSYWVDYWLGQLYSQTPAAPGILTLTATETATVEILATKNSDGSVLVMVVDRAVLSPSDNNGTGALRTAVIDISALGNFTTASQLNINAGTTVATGPQSVSITPASKLTVNLPGYGVAFLILKP